jgi:hypothetical protein
MFAAAISFLSLGCSQTNTSSVSATMQDNQSKDIKYHETADLKWIQYADPRADANFAIAKQDFTLLAFAGRATSFPGIDGESSTLQEQCGYQLLSYSSDALTSENELRLRKQLYQYAATFNQLVVVVVVACQRNNKED